MGAFTRIFEYDKNTSLPDGKKGADGNRKQDGKEIPVTFNLQGAKWIYSNYPEQFTSDHLATSAGGKVFNKVNIASPASADTKSTYQVLFSHQRKNIPDDVYLSVLLENTESSSFSFTKTNEGIRESSNDSDWTLVNASTWSAFFAGVSPKETVTVGAGSSKWLRKDFKVPSKAGLVSGNIRFEITGPHKATVYVYASTKTEVNAVGRTTVAPLSSLANMKQYSGSAEGFILNPPTIKLSDTDLATERKFIYLNYNSAYNKQSTSVVKAGNSSAGVTGSDLLPITCCDGITVKENTANANLGNWAAQYIFNVEFTNKTSPTKTFRVYIKTENVNPERGDFPVIQTVINGVSTVKYARMMGSDAGGVAWKCLEIDVEKGKTETASFQYVLGTNSQAGKKLYFEMVEKVLI